MLFIVPGHSIDMLEFLYFASGYYPQKRVGGYEGYSTTPEDMMDNTRRHDGY